MNDSQLFATFKAMYDDLIAPRKWVVLICVIAMVIAYLSLVFLPKDNIIEQEAEKLIELETGVNVDLTP